MYNPDTEILFPERVIPTLRPLRTDEWSKLIDQIFDESRQPNLDRTAFVLMMVKLCGCSGCNADSFRAMRGCTQCARQVVRRFRGNDKEINNLFDQSRSEVQQYLSKMTNSSSQ
jgi:hypothetical protein